MLVDYSGSSRREEGREPGEFCFTGALVRLKTVSRQLTISTSSPLPQPGGLGGCRRGYSDYRQISPCTFPSSTTPVLTHRLQKPRARHSPGKPPCRAALPKTQQEHLRLPPLDRNRMPRSNPSASSDSDGGLLSAPRLPDALLCQKADFLFRLEKIKV